MRTIKKLIILSVASSILSCNHKESAPQDEKDKIFEISKIVKSGFKKHGNSYKYTFIGEARNNSSNVYDDVYTTLEVQLELDNGSIITKQDYDSGFMTGVGDTEKVWKPNEVRKIDDHEGLDSDFIPVHYREYKVKKVVAVFDFDTEDLLNHTKNTFTDTIDITKQWNLLK